jgi:hypothetical protein
MSVFEGFGVDPGFGLNKKAVDAVIAEFGLNNESPS